MKNKVAFFSVVFPAIESYLDDYRNSLLTQTFKEFDLVLVNDGFNQEFLLDFFKDFNLVVLSPGETRAKHREVGIRYAKQAGYNYLILGDADDYFSNMRIAISVENLQKEGVDIVVNDLTIVNERKEVITQDYFSRRINKSTILDAEYLVDKNLFGLSNTAIKLTNIHEIRIPSSLKIVDWFLFSYLLESGAKSLFINHSLTYYRQHECNAIGINKMSVEAFKRQLNLKVDHFMHLSEFYPKYEEEYKKSLNLLQLDDSAIETIISAKRNIPNPLWWEIVNY